MTSPFRDVTASALAAAVHATACVAWVVGGDHLPGGRWLAVHLFTLGVLTNLVLAFSQHFGRTLTHQPAAHSRCVRWQPLAANVGIVAVLVGVASVTRPLTAAGGTVVTLVVLASWWQLRRMRAAALGARFAWVVRTYERAHGAFVHGAVLGVLLGVGLVDGRWYGHARLAHLHVMVLGWGGLTLLATIVFFGPTMVRTRIVTGADVRAAIALRHGATALTVAVLALLGAGVGSAAGTALRLLAAGALVGFAVAVTRTCSPVAVAAWRAGHSAPRGPVLAVAVWFPVVVWADAAVVASGRWQYLGAVGSVALLGVLAQSVAATLLYLAPTTRGDRAGGDDLRMRLERFGSARVVVANLGVLGVGSGAVVRGAAGHTLSTIGWAALGVAMVLVLLAGAWPRRAG